MYLMFQAKPIDWNDLWSKIAIAVFAAALGFAFAVLRDKAQLAATKKSRAATYLLKIAEAIENMATSFEQVIVPTGEGHLFDTLLELFDETMTPLVGNNMLNELRRLNTMAQKAEDLDTAIRMGHNYDIRPWIDDARRIAGELRGKAAALAAQ